MFLGLTERNPDAALREARALGADAVRMYVSWRRAVAEPGPVRACRPDFDPADATTRRLQLGPVRPAGPPGPGPRAEGHRQHRAGDALLGLARAAPLPAPGRQQAQARAVVLLEARPGAVRQVRGRRGQAFRGQVAFYSLWNEPNLENYLLPQRMKTSAGIVDMGGKQLRELYIAGYRAIRADDRRACRAGAVRRDVGHQLAPRHAVLGAVPEPARAPLQGRHQAAAGLLQAQHAAHRRAGRAPVQPERAGLGVLHQQDQVPRCPWPT